MWSITDVKPAKTFRENDQRMEFLLIWGTKYGSKIGPLMSIFHTSLKEAAFQKTINDNQINRKEETLKEYMYRNPKITTNSNKGKQQ